MKALPPGLKSHQQTPEFNEQTVPAGLLGEHTTAEGVWGVIRVLEGQLLYRIMQPEVEEHLLDEAHPGVVEPQVVHQVEIQGPVRFLVEFYRQS